MKALKITTKKIDALDERVKGLFANVKTAERLTSVGGESYSQQLEGAKTRYSDAVEERLAVESPIKRAVVNALRAVNGKAEAYALTTFIEIWSVAHRAEELLGSRGVAKKRRVGTTVTYEPSGPSANSYKYAAISTTIYLKRVADGWRLIGANRSSVYPKSTETFSLTISPEAAADINRAAFASITVRAAEAVAA